ATGLRSFAQVSRGIRGIDLPALQRQVEFLGRDLPERGQDALPQFNLAGVDGGVAVTADANPGLQQTVGVEAAGKPRRGAGALGQQFGGIERKGEYEAAAKRLGEAAAGKERRTHCARGPAAFVRL